MKCGPAGTVAAYLAVSVLSCIVACTNEADDRRRQEFFEAKNRPVLIEHCYECHSNSSKVPQGDLRVDDRDALHSGGATGPSVVPGRPDESVLITGHCECDSRLREVGLRRSVRS